MRFSDAAKMLVVCMSCGCILCRGSLLHVDWPAMTLQTNVSCMSYIYIYTSLFINHQDSIDNK